MSESCKTCNLKSKFMGTEYCGLTEQKIGYKEYLEKPEWCIYNSKLTQEKNYHKTTGATQDD